MYNTSNISEAAIPEFMEKLASNAPVPGGGGASALIGAVSAALCSMVANLTTGKKKYAEYQQDIEKILVSSAQSIKRLIELIDKDAEVFEPLSAAYGIPKEDPSRAEILENALVSACSVPMNILEEAYNLIDIIEELAVKGSRLAISDVGVAASACRCAMESAAMNVYINTKLMKNTDFAEKTNAKADMILSSGTDKCNDVYRQITDELRKRVL